MFDFISQAVSRNLGSIFWRSASGQLAAMEAKRDTTLRKRKAWVELRKLMLEVIPEPEEQPPA